MINIILKNRNLIKVYKYSKELFKFLNKHLYILSILSFLRRSRNSFYYKLISYTLKLVIFINLIITSGLFFTLTDFTTPFNIISSIYKDLLYPYLDMSKEIYTRLIDNLNSSSITKKINNSIELNDIKDSTSVSSHSKVTPVIEPQENIEFNINIKNILFYTGLGVLLYFIYYIPGPSIAPEEIVKYNTLNQSFIQIKIIFKDLFNSFFNPGDPKGKGPNLGVLDTELTDLKASGSVDSHSPSPFNTPGPSTPININRDVAKIVNPLLYLNKSIQTDLDSLAVGRRKAMVVIMDQALPTHVKQSLLNSTQLLIKNITD
jgi:hypothetical protein